MGARAGLIAAVLALAGCASDIHGSALGERRVARAALDETAAQGPVPLVLLDKPASLSPINAAAWASSGIGGRRIGFKPVVPPSVAVGRRVVMWFAAPADASGAAGCATQAQAASSPSGDLLAVFCDGVAPVAETRAAGPIAPDDLERMIWRSTSRLFPDNYVDTYGFNLFGWRIDLGGAYGV